MSVPIVAIRSALELALYGYDGAFPTAWENMEFKPTSGIAHQRVTFIPARPGNPTMGDDFRREQGVFRIVLVYPSNGSGTKAAADRASGIAALFKRGATFTDSGLTIVISRSPHIGQGRAFDGWWALTIDVSWYADVTG